MESYHNLDWLRRRLQAILSSSKFCGLCLEYNGNFCHIYMELVINKQNFSRCLKDILNYVFNDDVESIMSCQYICDNCTEKTIQAYLFIHNSKQMSRIINKCVSDMYTKVIDINHQIKNDLNNTNLMISLENDEGLYKSVIDTKIVEIVPTAKPIPMKIESPKLEDTKEAEPVKTILKTPEVILKPNKVEIKPVKATPNITLKKGHIVIKPLNSARQLTPCYNTYQCPNCSDIYTTYRSLKEHEKAKHNKSVYSCNLCNKTYNTRQYLNLHYKTHEKAKCKFCQMIVAEADLINHLKVNHAHLIFPCKFCDMLYYTQDSLVTHFNSNHLVNNTKIESQCIMCLKNIKENNIKMHKCKFSCSECFVMPCIHYKYLMSYREQVLNHANNVKCLECHYVAARKEHLISHANREHLDHHPFTCADCSQQFYTKLSLKMHITQFHQDLSCEYCDFEFKEKKTLENHRKTCKSVIRAFSCNNCMASFDTEEELLNHENLKHNSSVHACNLCKGKFLTLLNLEEHRVRVHGGIQYKKRRKHIECSICNIMFKNIKEMIQHEKQHKENEIFPCKVCSKQFKSLMKLYVHNQRHYTIRIVCSHCNKKVASSFYPQHIVRCPYKNKKLVNHICEVCGEGFQSESTLRFHQKIHSEPQACKQCNKFIKPSSLKRHMELAHGTDKKKYRNSEPTIECDLCGHLVRKKDDLDAHMNRYHLKVKPYICNICNKEFCGKIRLKEHKATHSTDNSCFCSICDKKLANRVCLKMHLRIHTGERPYECNVCGQKFRSSSMMKTHRLKKHLPKTVSCPLCENMFYILKDMRHHFKKAHWKFKGKPFNVREVEGLSEKYYHLFDDRRILKLDTL